MKYLNSLNHYRALSIILIVAIHSFYTADIKLDSYVSQFFFNSISGATLNFIFISGFLFYQVFYKRFEYSKFVKSRVDRFLKPYLILSALPILVCLITIPMYWDNANIIKFSDGNLAFWYIISGIKYLITGAHITAYWYIPFMMIMVVISPLFIAFIKLKLKSQLIIFGLLLVIASLVQRPFERTDLLQALHSVVYFSPLYLFGIICAIQKENIYKLLKGKEMYLLAIAFAFVVLQTSQGAVGVYQSEFFEYNGIGLLIFKMVFLCLFFMVWLHRFEEVRSPIINYLAETSFTIYFLHVYFLKIIITVKTYYNLNFEGYALLAFIAIVFILIVSSMVTAKVIYKLMPNYSFILIGYGKKPIKSFKESKMKKEKLSNIEV